MSKIVPSNIHHDQQSPQFKLKVLNASIVMDQQKIIIEEIRGFDENFSEGDFLNLFDTEFEPIINFHKNGGYVELSSNLMQNLEVRISQEGIRHIEKNFGRFVENSRIKGRELEESDFQVLMESLSRINSKENGDLNNYLRELSNLRTDERGIITKESFVKHARINPNLKGLNINDVDGRYWYGGGSVDIVRKAYLLEAGFTEFDWQKNLFAKGNDIIFLGSENLGDQKKLKELCRIIARGLERQQEVHMFFPVNTSCTHWTNLEIEIKTQPDSKFLVNSHYYDPLGKFMADVQTAKHLNQKFIGIFGKDLVAQESKLLIHSAKRQSDLNSCGPVSCWYVKQRINKNSCDDNKSFEVGALELRLEQLKVVSKNLGSGAGYNLYNCYQKPRGVVDENKNQISAAQTKCQEILRSLAKINLKNFGFYHSVLRELFVQASDENLTTNKELFKKIKSYLEEFQINKDQKEFLASVIYKLQSGISFEDSFKQAENEVTSSKLSKKPSAISAICNSICSQPSTKIDQEIQAIKPLQAIQNQPATLIKTISIYPLLENARSIWYRVAQNFVNDNSKQDLRGLNPSNRANKFKVAENVYKNVSEPDLENIGYALLSILVKVANENKLKGDQVVAVVNAAKERGGIYNQADEQGNYLSNEKSKTTFGYINDYFFIKKAKPIGDIKNKNGVTIVPESVAKKFSADFQKECFNCGIYSGREVGKQVGLRTTFIPDDVVKTLNKLGQDFFSNAQIKQYSISFISAIEDRVKEEMSKSKTIYR